MQTRVLSKTWVNENCGCDGTVMLAETVGVHSYGTKKTEQKEDTRFIESLSGGTYESGF